MIPLIDQLRECERELALRKSAYPRWVREGKLSQHQANARLATMEAITASIRKLWDLEQISLEMRGDFE